MQFYFFLFFFFRMQIWRLKKRKHDSTKFRPKIKWLLLSNFKDSIRLIFAKVIRLSRLSLWVSHFIYFKYTPAFFYWVFFFNGCKEINRLITKGMSNIYLKVTNEKNVLKRRSQNFDFLILKNSSPDQFLRSYDWRKYWNFKLLVAI